MRIPESKFKTIMHIRITTDNIHRCIGRDGIMNPHRIVDVLGEIDADFIALQELSSPVNDSSEEPFDILYVSNPENKAASN